MIDVNIDEEVCFMFVIEGEVMIWVMMDGMW